MTLIETCVVQREFPFFGWRATLRAGSYSYMTANFMPKGPRRRAIETKLHGRKILAANLQRFSARRFDHLEFKTDRAAALAKVAGVGPSTVMRAFNAQRSTSLDTIERLAVALEVPLHKLLQAPSARRVAGPARRARTRR